MRFISVAAVVAIAATGAPALAATASDRSAPRLDAVLDAIPSWARGVAPARVEPAAAPVQVSLLLKGRHPAALNELVARVSDPASPSYRHFLTRAEYQRRFGPTAAEVAAATSWLRDAGFVIDSTSTSLITAHAAASVVGKVFDTTFGLFRVAGELLRSPLTEPSLPGALHPFVSAVMGLAQNRAVTDAGPAPAYVNARPCSHFYGQKIAKSLPTYLGKHQPYALCGYTAGQLRSAYGVNQVASTGKGAAVGIVDPYASPTIESDVDTWSRHMGLPALRSGQLTQHVLPGLSSLPEVSVVLPIIDPQDVEPEESLDVEAVHAMAPGADIDYYAAIGGAIGLNEVGFEIGIEPLFVALAQAVSDDKVAIISNSWGAAGEHLTPGDLQIFDAVANQAAAEGITLDFSSGDSGDELAASGKRQADFPATSPEVTAVGGTTLEVGANGKRISESYWGTDIAKLDKGSWDLKDKAFSSGAGGGVSTAYAEPAWQRGVVPPAEATYGGLSAPGRVVPDVSMVADTTTGMLIGLTEHFADGSNRYGEFRIGGTSVSCPLFSGLLALAAAERHQRLGLVTPTLYAEAGKAAERKRLFYDPVTVPLRDDLSTLADVRPDHTATDNPKSPVAYSLRILSNLGTLQSLRGYDDSTGLGTPNAGPLVAALAGVRGHAGPRRAAR